MGDRLDGKPSSGVTVCVLIGVGLGENWSCGWFVVGHLMCLGVHI